MPMSVNVLKQPHPTFAVEQDDGHLLFVPRLLSRESAILRPSQANERVAGVEVAPPAFVTPIPT